MKNILVTGASSGIGEAVVRYLSDMGYCVIMVARSEEKMSRIASELSGSSYIFPYDLTDIDNIDSIFSFCRDNGIVLDGMVHSAGISMTMPMKGIEPFNIDSIFRINYNAFVELTKLFSIRKNSNNNSSVVVLSSLASFSSSVGQAVYASSKAAVNEFVKIAAKEVRKREIRINAVAPANVFSPMTADLEERFPVDIKETQPFGFIPAEQIAYLTEFLLSDKSKFITGAIIPVSAGNIY